MFIGLARAIIWMKPSSIADVITDESSNKQHKRSRKITYHITMNKKLIAISVAAAGILAIVPMVFAQTTATTSTSVTTKIACVGAAVATREASIDTAMTTFTAATNAAYSARATALQQAYANTTLSTVKAAVKTAWSTFSASEKSARKTWQTARNTAWATYRTTAVACKAPAGTGDGVDSGLEVSGN